jgi:hypothetical protein
MREMLGIGAELVEMLYFTGRGDGVSGRGYGLGWVE